LANAPTARAQQDAPTQGDFDILRFLAAAELIEADLWRQYNELAASKTAKSQVEPEIQAYTNAIKVLDGDMDQYIHDNTDDEITHAAFLNGLSDFERGRARQSGSVSYSAEQSSNRRSANRTAHQSDAAYRGHELVGRATASAPKTPISEILSRKPSQTYFTGNFQRFRATTPTSVPPGTYKRSPTRLASTLGLLSKAAPACNPSLAQRVTDPEVLRNPA